MILGPGPNPLVPPPAGSRVGIRRRGSYDWYPYVVVELREDIPGGTLVLRWPGNATSLLGLRVLDDWEWRPAVVVKFRRSCPQCYGTGWHHKEKGKSYMMTCTKCKGKGHVAHRSPFRGEATL